MTVAQHQSVAELADVLLEHGRRGDRGLGISCTKHHQ